MTKEELETNIAALELLINETADKSIDFQTQLEQAKQKLANINKPELTPLQFDLIQETIEEGVGNFDFDDISNYQPEFELDYDNKVNLSSLNFENYELIEKIVEKVHKLFTEAECPEELNTTEDDNHPVEKLQN